MRITKTRAHFITNYAAKLAVLLIIILLLFMSTTVVARGGGGGGHGGGHSGGGGGHGGGRGGRGGGHEEEGRPEIGGGGMVHRPVRRNGDSALNPFADGTAAVLTIIFLLFI
ncbi:unnamed protein product [Microthlaspi erraticum]|uniref:Glycine-rich protein n=1 Tax=Microthlaspi erraticum TaxID=1685480 RepID=A0A6D2JW21_9BRAS|nr:unnamed protein product [Microthlaspi erraticum]CAA7056317.1 unnamed protein product [Microthlaspi erraticum]